MLYKNMYLVEYLFIENVTDIYNSHSTLIARESHKNDHNQSILYIS